MLKHVETSNQVGNVNLTVCTNLCIVWVRRAERGALPSSLHVLHQQNSLHTLFFAIETAQPHMSGWMVSIAQRQVVNQFVLIARQFDVSRATQDFDPLKRLMYFFSAFMDENGNLLHNYHNVPPRLYNIYIYIYYINLYIYIPLICS